MNIIALHPLPHAVRATVSVPGSKSLTNRALIIAALTPSVVVIHHPLVSDDTRAMAECLTRLGIRVQQKKNKWIVHGGIQQIRASARVLNAGLSGTTMRFLTALACIIPGITILSGEQGLNARPIGDLVSALQKRGASIGYLKKPGFPPIRVREQRLKPGVITINGTTSSQFISALLMMLPVIGRTKVAVSGKPVSRSYIDMTVDFMRQCGVRVRETRPNHFEAPEGPYTCRH
ncbi:3-phosphoshikimate 1-carboxyvinyltransferase, partial [Candidatus Gottesmanbacteria bacterium]|nr:3-phosphoshikimate 1-carboxyvinyltransferase [Candidatus Gottesmanbacteria bacterium]